MRERYREMLEKSDVAEPLRGFEFLAYLESGGAVTERADEAAKNDENAGAEEGLVIADEGEGAANTETSFTSNSIGLKH